MQTGGVTTRSKGKPAGRGGAVKRSFEPERSTRRSKVSSSFSFLVISCGQSFLVSK